MVTNSWSIFQTISKKSAMANILIGHFNLGHVSERGHINHPWIPIVLWLHGMNSQLCISYDGADWSLFSQQVLPDLSNTSNKCNKFCFLMLMSFFVSTLTWSWFAKGIPHLFSFPFQACPHRSLYFLEVEGPVLASLPPLAHFHAPWHNFNTS